MSRYHPYRAFVAEKMLQARSLEARLTPQQVLAEAGREVRDF